MSDTPTPTELLEAASHLVEHATHETRTLWARAAALLARQALEEHVRAFLEEKAPGSQAASFTAQLLFFRTLHPDETAANAAYTWSALSRATHHHGYELPPTAPDLRTWIATTRDLTRIR